ncbi:cytochrome c oxidase subunit 3 [Nguyenibacter vanlangensis]|uniref:Cytochrome c oxidase subunit 3 n=1 Tax=Nguyenibacter vanlangensis TaxID=1216886 RepID=A0ABZ3D9C4_9PROT
MTIQDRVEFQFRDMREQAATAIAGMWLFLATEGLFFGGLFLAWLTYRVRFPAGFAQAARQTDLAIGTINTMVLMTSSALFACGLPAVRLGHRRRLILLCLATGLLGLVFMGLKLYEWRLDLARHLLPGAIARDPATPPGAALFWMFYWLGTVLHMAHLAIGLGLIAWIGRLAARGRVHPGYYTPVEAVGLYWSFVDLLWMILFSLIYLGAS